MVESYENGHESRGGDGTAAALYWLRGCGLWMVSREGEGRCVPRAWSWSWSRRRGGTRRTAGEKVGEEAVSRAQAMRSDGADLEC